jgi:hypothetical protein
MPPELRPTHFAYYPGWMGQAEFFGDLVLGTPLGPAFHKRRLVGDADMQLLAATWDHAHSAERPLDPVAHWTVVDRIDVVLSGAPVDGPQGCLIDGPHCGEWCPSRRRCASASWAT